VKHNRRGAFTLIELLVVISLLVLLLAIGVPAFANLLRSSERSLANNAMSTAIRAARDIAQRSEGGDGALVFSIEPGGRMTMTPCIQVGEVLDRTSGALVGQVPVRRDVFVPHPLFKSSQLPAGWTVRGFAPAGSIDAEWYGDQRTGNAYEIQTATGPNATNTEPQWLLPETAYYKGNQFSTTKADPDQDPDNGRNRQTFMMRFAAGTGELVYASTGSIVVLPIAPDASKQPSQRAITLPGHSDRPFVRARDAADLRLWARQILNDSAFEESGQNRVERLKLIGDESVDTVLTKTVPWVTMASERQLAADISKGKVGSGIASGQTLDVSLDRRTGTLYQAGEAPQLTGADPVKLARVLNALINGQMVEKDSTDKPLPIVPEAQVFLVSAYQGNTLEVRQ
jgi:prepilin-type N-terminal cleavage/methylation domain-containing protein